MTFATLSRVLVLKAANRASLCNIHALSDLKTARTVYIVKCRELRIRALYKLSCYYYYYYYYYYYNSLH